MRRPRITTAAVRFTSRDHSHLRPCPQCWRRRPVVAFPLLNNPGLDGLAVRLLCDDCLVDGGHMRAPEEPPEDLWVPGKKARARAERAVQAHRLVVNLVDRALDDPDFEDCLRRALAAVEHARTAPQRYEAAEEPDEDLDLVS